MKFLPKKSLTVILIPIYFIVFGGFVVKSNASSDPPGFRALEDTDTLDLPTAARMALAANPSLGAARARLEQARQAVAQARSAYWPSLDLEGRASRVDMSETAYQTKLLPLRAINPFADLENPQDYYAVELVGRWILFDGFARKFNLAVARYGEQASAAASNEARRLLLSALASAFLSAQLARENITIADADVTFNQRLLKEAQLRYEVGSGALSDVLNFQVKANSALTQRNQSASDFDVSKIALAALIGLPQGVIPDHVRLADLEPINEQKMQAPQLSELLVTAQTLRPDLQQRDRAVDLAQARTGVARAGYYPTLALSAKWSGEREGDAGFDGDDFGNTVALGLSYPIFNGGLRKARRQEAAAQLVEAQQVREDTLLALTREVRTTAASLSNVQRQLILQESNAELVRKNRDLVEKEYKAGVGSLVRLNEAQRDLTAAQVRLALARVALLSAWYDVYTATGEILNRFKP